MKKENHLHRIDWFRLNLQMDIIIGTIILLFAFLLMSIGVIFNNKPLRGSCGGNPDGSCSVCGGDINKCEGQLSDNNPI